MSTLDAFPAAIEILSNTLQEKYNVPRDEFFVLLNAALTQSNEFYKAKELSEFHYGVEADGLRVNLQRETIHTLKRKEQEFRPPPPELPTSITLEGKELSDVDLKYLFGIGRAKALNRISIDGVSPLLALSSSDAEYTKMHPIDKLFSGWSQLCTDLSMPTTETDVIVEAFRIPFGSPDFYWGDAEVVGDALERSIGVVGSHYPGVAIGNGAIWGCHDNPKCLMLTWICLFKREFKIGEILYGYNTRQAQAKTTKIVDILKRYTSSAIWNYNQHNVLPTTEIHNKYSIELRRLDVTHKDRDENNEVHVGAYQFMHDVLTLRKELRNQKLLCDLYAHEVGQGKSYKRTKMGRMSTLLSDEGEAYFDVKGH